MITISLILERFGAYMERHIIAISGGGFSEMEGAFIDQYILKIKRKASPLRIAFVATASNDAQSYIGKFYNAFKCEHPSHLAIPDFELATIQEVVNSLDIIYVGGGNTKYMLDVWRKTGFDEVLKKAYEQGVILTGISAGAMCWFEHCYTEISESEYGYFEGLGILKGALCPHHNDSTRKKYFDKWSLKNSTTPTYPLEDHENLHFVNEQCIAKLETY
ncbi:MULTISPECIES: Type 1 glutamine amidotransferase-like domain-containing protein [Solibacillus]|uniref:Peptidase E n=1 Tax=Solibacillus merdavium TaxID=2762218 RepID=A0ABR8XKE3_9BACL|nr:peptidase E [Solibacillus merdavium]MBD8032408.1 peptidase E [Solibacillus merdavium]